MFNRTNINLLFSICYGLIILATDLAIYILSVFLFILQDIRGWGSLQMKVITGQLRATLNTDASRPPRLNGQSQIRQIGSSNPFSSVNPEYFLNQTQPGPPRTGRVRRRMRREGTPTRPLSSRAPRRPRRLLPAPLSPLSQTPPPTYTESMMVPDHSYSRDGKCVKLQGRDTGGGGTPSVWPGPITGRAALHSGDPPPLIGRQHDKNGIKSLPHTGNPT